MALVDSAFYVNFGDGSTTGYYAVAQWAALTSFDCGKLIRQLAAPAVGSERVFVAVVGHVASGAAEPTWVTTRGGKTTDATITWQEATGLAGLNGNAGKTPNWNTVKNTAITLGQLITDVAGTIYLICTTAGTAGNGAEPSWAAYTTTGATTVDNGATWTNLGVIGNFTGWQAPHARLANALAANWGQAGNDIYVGDNHAETQASAMTITFPGTAASPNNCYCVDHTVAVPGSGNLKTTGVVTTTGNFGITINGTAYIYGLTFQSGNGANSVTLSLAQTSTNVQIFEACSLQLLGTSGGQINLSTATVGQTGKVVFKNTTVKFSNAVSGIATRMAAFSWYNTASAIVLGTVPTNLFLSSNAGAGNAWIEGVDLSAMTSTLVQQINGAKTFVFKDCKLAAGVTVAATPINLGGAEVYVIRSDSSGTNYIEQKYTYAGTQTDSTTITRTGGATDGTTAKSRKLATTANSKWEFPFETNPIAIWNDNAAANVTATIEGTWNQGSVPNNDDIFVEVEYLGSSSTSQGSFATSSKANNLASGSALPTSAAVWGTAGGTGAIWSPFKLVVTLGTSPNPAGGTSPQPGQKGAIYAYVKAAKPSVTFYIDPLITLS